MVGPITLLEDILAEEPTILLELELDILLELWNVVVFTPSIVFAPLPPIIWPLIEAKLLVIPLLLVETALPDLPYALLPMPLPVIP